MNVTGFVKDLWHQPFFASFLVVLACLCFYFLNRENRISKKYIWLIYSLVLSTVVIVFCGKVIERIYNPQIWDFTAFYLWGKVAASGNNFYLSEPTLAVFNSLDLPFSNYIGFADQIIHAGFLYPPPTILLFVLLGYLSYSTAFIAWSVFILLFVPGCIYLIYDMYFKRYKLNGLMLVTTLFFLLPTVRSTFIFSQTNYILLFLLLLINKYSDKNFAGILLALALFTKPYMIILVPVFVLRKQWKTLGYFIVSSAFLIGLTVLFFGVEPFKSYLFNNPSTRLPGWVFSEGINQSLHAVLLRAGLISINTPVLFTCITIGSLLLTAVYLFYLLKRKLYDYIWAVLLLVGLILYPGTLDYYGVLLLFVIFQFFNEKNQLGFNMYLNIPIIAVFYYLSMLSVFTCFCFLLCILVLKSFTRLKVIPNYNK